MKKARSPHRTKNKSTWQAWNPQIGGRWLLGVALLSSLVAGGIWGTMKIRDPFVMPLQLVRIDGPLRHLDRRAVESAVGRVIDGNFFTVDVDRVRVSAERLPWVERVSVRRVWPGTLLLEVKEQQPLARWGGRQLVNRSGGTFTPRSEEIPSGLPLLFGPEGSSRIVVEHYLRLNPRLAAVGLELEQMQMDARLAWRMTFDDGLKLQLGSGQIEGKLDRFLRIYPRLREVPDRRLVGVDLRYTNGFAARWEVVEAQSEEAEQVVGVGRGRA